LVDFFSLIVIFYTRIKWKHNCVASVFECSTNISQSQYYAELQHRNFKTSKTQQSISPKN